MRYFMLRRFLCGALGVHIAVVAASAAAATMNVLLQDYDLRIEYASGASVTITFNADGTYQTDTGSSGTWTLDGEALCTVRDSDGAASCGVLPSDKSAGDVWESTDGNGSPVTASVIPRAP